MKKKLLVGTTIIVSGLASTNVVACGTSSDSSEQKIELNKLLPNNTDLEVIYLEDNNKPTPTQIKGALRTWIRKFHKNKLNKILSEITISDSDITTTSAIIKTKNNSKIYKGQTTIIFIVDKTITLNEILPDNTHLGIIKTDGHDLTQEHIKTQIRKKFLDIDEEKLYILKFNENSAQVVGDAKTYLGHVNVTYQFDKSIFLRKEIANDTHLGIFNTHGSNPTESEIKTWLLKTIQAKYPNINQEKIQIFNITNHNALLTGISDTYQGQVNIKYKIDESVALNTKIIDNIHLGTFWTHGKNVTNKTIKNWIINKIYEKHPLINQEKIYIANEDIRDNSAIVSGISDTYQGQTTVNFTINHSIDLEEILNFDLRTIYIGKDDKANENNIKHHLLKQNFDVKAITINNISNNSALVSGDGLNYNGVVIINFKTTNFIEIVGITGEVTSLVATSDGSIYVGTKISDGVGAVFFKEKTEKVFKNKINGISGEVTSLVKDSKDRIYIASKTRDEQCKIYRLQANNHLDFVEMKLPYNDIYVTALICGQDDCIYAIAIDKNNTKGLFLKCLTKDKDFKKIKDSSYYPGEKFVSLVAKADGTIYLSGNQRMFEYNNKVSIEDRIYFLKANIHETIKTLTIAPNGVVYVGGTQGLYQEQAKEKNGIKFKLMIDTVGEIVALVSDNDGNIFAGSNDGNVYLCLATKQEFKALTGIVGEIVTLTKDNNGNIYIGTKEGKIYQY